MDRYEVLNWCDLDKAEWNDFASEVLFYLKTNVTDREELLFRTGLEDDDTEAQSVWTNYRQLNGEDAPHLMWYVFRKDGHLYAVRPSDIFHIGDDLDYEDEIEKAMDEAAELLRRDTDAFADRYMREPDWTVALCLDGEDIDLPECNISVGEN